MSVLRAESSVFGLVAAARDSWLGVLRHPSRPGLGGWRTLAPACVFVFYSFTTFFPSYPVLLKGDGSDGDWGEGSTSVGKIPAAAFKHQK